MTQTDMTQTDGDPWGVAARVTDPELPMVTLADLGVLRDARIEDDGTVVVEITPTYTGCPAIEAMSADIERVLHEHGVPQVTVQTVLSPAWTTNDISDEGRRKLREFGIAPPRTQRATRPVPIELGPTRTAAHAPGRVADAPPDAGLEADPVRCPHCGCADTELLSRFSSTACKALRRCLSCREPFDHFKEL
jgi:ring-1,2-phenylacetyl-CoA epoxidase subunit PaaD